MNPPAAIEWRDLPAQPVPELHASTTHRVLLPQALYDDILRHARHDLKRECIGLLLGHPASATASSIPATQIPATQILAAPPALAASASLTHVALHAETWPTLWRSLPPDSNAAQLIGWYHSHPGHGVFLSPQDLFTQSLWFRQPAHIALVVDPIRGQAAAFHGPRGHPAELKLVPTPKIERRR